MHRVAGIGLLPLVLLSLMPIPKLCLASSDQEPLEVVLNASSDTYIDQADQGRNHGLDSAVLVRSVLSRNARALLAFNLSTIPPGANVLSARLSLCLETPPASPRNYMCYRTSSQWSESTATWASAPQTTPMYATASSSPGDGDLFPRVEWDVTAHVQKFLVGIREYLWTNYGWTISDTAEDSPTAEESMFCSRQFPTEKFRPGLVVRFIPPKLEIVVDSTSIMTGSWTKLTIKRTSQDGVLVAAGDRLIKKSWIDIGDLTVRLSSTSPTAVFSLKAGGSPADLVTVPEGLTQLELYYQDTSSGSQNLGAKTDGFPRGYYESGSLAILVTRDEVPPAVSAISGTPESPVMGEAVMISASVNDTGSGVKDVLLYYSVSGGANWIKSPMTFQGGVYRAYIPSQSMLAEVQYHVEATDFAGNTAKSSTAKFSVGIPPLLYVGVGLIVVVAVVGIRAIRRRPKDE